MGLFSVLAAAAASFFFGAVWYMVLVPFGTWYCLALGWPLLVCRRMQMASR